ncbi:MAG: hypothetical protein LBU70_02515 [Chitinispirillales bacterium]|jgi:hypothetical protein|nr:hypothetical protein [Chitinispirillales bacterium]
MKKLLQAAVFTLCIAAFSHGTVPIQNMSAFSLGAEYAGMLHGHEGLYLFDSTALTAHFLRLHYAPIPFVRFSAGIGGSNTRHLYQRPSEVFIGGEYVGGELIRGHRLQLPDGERVDDTRLGMAFTGGGALYLPKLLDFLSLTAGYDIYYLRARQELVLPFQVAGPVVPGTPGVPGDPPIPATPDAPGPSREFNGRIWEGETAATLHIPHFGVVVHAGRFADIGLGGSFYTFNILRKNRTEYRYWTINAPVSGGTPLVTTPEPPVRHSMADSLESWDQMRLYASLTFNERESGAYLTLGASFALDNQSDHNAFSNTSLWTQIGMIMKDPRGGSPRHGTHTRAYLDLKWRQERMADDLIREPDDEDWGAWETGN